jgi:hypothetical protein
VIDNIDHPHNGDPATTNMQAIHAKISLVEYSSNTQAVWPPKLVFSSVNENGSAGWNDDAR